MSKLQKKMIAVAFLSVILVFSILVAGLNYSLIISNAKRADAMTRAISFNDGKMPKAYEFDEEEFKNQTEYEIELNPESEFRTRYFIVKMNDDNKASDFEDEHISSVDEETVLKMADQAIETGNETGYYGVYRFRIVGDIKEPDYVIFLDCREYYEAQGRTLHIAMEISLIFALMVTAIFACLSSRILRPFEQNQKAQKQFITDASHELKTPLAIISANAEVLKYKSGDNEWTQNIISQTGRMGKLINQLLILSRMEEVGEEAKREETDISQALNESIGKFEEVFKSRGVTVERAVDEGIVIYGVKNQIENLCDILIENASKYVTEGGKVGITLVRSGRRTVFSVFNTASLDDDFDGERIFDRFYRTDKSRTSSTGGHGIGLSIARRIVEQHKGSITAKAENNGVIFTVIL